MITALVLTCVALTIFVVYNAILIKMYGIPISLSHTFYYLQEHGHWGWWFTVMMWSVTFLLIYPWIYAGNVVSSWSHWLGFLPFLSCACLIFVSAAANARKEWGVQGVHMWCAKLAAVFALLWICIVCWKIMYVIPIWIVLIGAIAHLTKTAKFGRDYWIEWVAFGPTFTVIIWEAILQL